MILEKVLGLFEESKTLGKVEFVKIRFEVFQDLLCRNRNCLSLYSRISRKSVHLVVQKDQLMPVPIPNSQSDDVFPSFKADLLFFYLL
jgi:hypothetical protein